MTERAISRNAAELDRLDLQIERYERRRDSLLQQIERRRAGWAKLVDQASQEVIDAEISIGISKVGHYNA